MARKPPRKKRVDSRERRAVARHSTEPTTAYARDVVAGKILAGRPVRLACERHLRDIREQKKRGLVWRPEMAQRAIDFFAEVLLLDDVDENGDQKPFTLEPFQVFIVGSCFGWYRADGFRRFRVAYCETGKGSGKSPLAAGIGLYGFVADKQPAAEVYSAATTQDQAAIAWKDAKAMVEASPDLKAMIDVQVSSLNIGTKSVFRPLSAEHKGLDGKRVHVAIIDEYHEHPTSIVLEKMRAGTKRQRNALVFVITNSGYDRTSPCWKYRTFVLGVLEGLIENDAVFGYVCSLDLCDKCQEAGNKAPGCAKCDDWRNPKTWSKANPGLNTILPEQYLREQVDEAVGMPSKENIVRRLNFCEWTEQFEKWLPMEAWDRVKLVVDERALKGRRFFGGLDMASRDDFAAWILLFPDGEGGYELLCRFFLPEASIAEGTSNRTEEAREMLKHWADQKWITLTDGKTTDQDLIEEQILKDCETFELVELAFDRHDVTQLVTHLIDALGAERVIQFPQTMAGISTPAKELESLVKDELLNHGGNPVLRWMAANTVIRHGPDQMIKPDKAKSPEKIDGITATCFALGRAIVQPEGKESGYDQQQREIEEREARAAAKKKEPAAESGDAGDEDNDQPPSELIDSW